MTALNSSYVVRCQFAECEREATVHGLRTSLSLCDYHFIGYLERTTERLVDITGEVSMAIRAMKGRLIEHLTDARNG